MMPDVARRLLGEPPRIEAGGATWRYRARGSLAVHVAGPQRGLYRDHEAGVSGGVLELVCAVLQTDRSGALAWLADNRLIEPTSRPGASPRRPLATGGTTAPPRQPEAPYKPPENRPTVPTADLAARILSVAAPATDPTPARRYLRRRWAWPPDGIGPDLPATVRWLPGAAAREIGEKLPADAAGALVFVLTDPAGALAPAVKLEALAPDGKPLRPRWRRARGSARGLVFVAADAPGGSLWLAEGEVDALALALTGAGGAVRGAGGSAGFTLAACTDPERRPVVVAPDGDGAGARPAAVLRAALADLGRACSVQYAATGDPAGSVAAWCEERAAIREHDGNQTREDAELGAWADLAAAADRLGGLRP